MKPSDTELQLLETIYSRQSDPKTLSQRDLAGAAGLSLGMTNALLKRFAERGWVKLMHLSGRSLRYILTAEGMEEVLHRSLSYFTRAVRSASLYRDKIDIYVRGLSKSGITSVVLEGPAELDFLFDYSCERHGLEFIKNPQEKRRETLSASAGTMFVTARSFTALDEDCKDIRPGETDSGSEAPAQHASQVRLADILFDCADYLTAGGGVLGK